MLEVFMNNNTLLKRLFDNQDLKYKEFNDRIVNTKIPTIGVRTPVIKSIAKEINKGDYERFLSDVGHDYHEQILTEGLVIANLKSPYETLSKMNAFIDKIDNWAVCDMVCSACKKFRMIKPEVLSFVKTGLKSNNPWRVRFSFVTLLDYFVEEAYLDFIFSAVDNDKNDFYYVMMAKAWLISECYVKFPLKTFNYLCNTKLDKVTYNKAISKICDSYRVSKEDKIKLKTMQK